MYTSVILLLSLIAILYFCLYHTHLNRKIYNDPIIQRIKADVSRLDPKIQHISFYSSNESYTEDKKKIFICTKDNNGKYYDYNMLMYVAIHECSHALTDVIDPEHKTPEFRNMFSSLLLKAKEIGIYNPTEPLVDLYCGLRLDVKNMMR